MEKNYTYEVTENGYFILVDGKKVIHQYEPFIPNKELSYEENAKVQIEELKKANEEALNKQNEITLEERVAILEDLLIEQYESELS